MSSGEDNKNGAGGNNPASSPKRSSDSNSEASLLSTGSIASDLKGLIRDKGHASPSNKPSSQPSTNNERSNTTSMQARIDYLALK